MITVFWPSVLCYYVWPWKRRGNWELFRYSHNMGLILVPAALWHSTHAWQYLFPGIALWGVDFALRFVRATEIVKVEEVSPALVEAWTDRAPGRQISSSPEKITKISFTWPGQARIHSPGMYVLVNLPQISAAEWHPFSLSSSPLDPVATIHVKHMGWNTFTGAVHDLATLVSHERFKLNIDGPYGPCMDFNEYARVVLVAGGIGVTAMLSAWRFIVQRARLHQSGSLRCLHLVWVARSPDIFGVFENELADILGDIPIQIKISLYCSTSQGKASCSLGHVTAGTPNFADIFADEVQLGLSCAVRACGPPGMVNACAKAAACFGDSVQFEQWSFIL